MQKQAKYIAAVSSENETFSCNQYIAGLVLPWLIAILGNHLQVFALLVNWTSLICVIQVSIFFSFLMWTTQLEESLVHE
jgi:hypothetical protein